MIPIFKPYVPDQLHELSTILQSGALAYGSWGKAFEKELGKFIGAENILTSNSFNTAMLVLLSTLGLKTGDEVLASPMSCLASNQPFITKGLKVKWIDIDPNTGTMDPDSLLQSISKDSRAVFHNHHCGIPGYIDEINSIARSQGLLIIDDCIEAFGSEYKGRMVGNTGADAAIYSFQTVRLPNTIDGGALLFKNPEFTEKARKIRDYGIERSRFRDQNNEINVNCDITLEGYGALMSEINSYIGLQQMKDLPALLFQQRKNAEIWRTTLKTIFPDIIPLGYRNDINPNFWIFSILTDRKSEMLSYFREKGFYASGIHVSNDIYTIFGKQASLKGVKAFSERHLALPSGWWINENQMQNV